jgi:hypothetical protein
LENSYSHDFTLRYDYTLAREYNWNVKNKASKGYEETYFFVVREDGVFYNELETRWGFTWVIMSPNLENNCSCTYTVLANMPGHKLCLLASPLLVVHAYNDQAFRW